ncbi:MAG: hypothetical protein ABJ004_01620 [Cyclobacteriaceae bacterium]
MALSFFTANEFLKHKTQAVNAHGLHSPFLFDLYNQVIKARDIKLKNNLKAIRKTVFSSNETLTYTDPKTRETRNEQTGTWARRVTSSLRFSVFLIKLIDYLQAQTVLETGAAAGINAASLSHSTAHKIVTMEGSVEIAQLARQTINKFGKQDVDIIEGEITDTFADSLSEYSPNLIFLDADHRKDTIRFYIDEISKMKQPPKCILIHDIYWSKDMKEAWLEVVQNPTFSLTIDLFEVGLVFPNYQMEKQHFRIKF